MIYKHDFYGHIAIDPDPEESQGSTLETLLRLCRSCGLYYDITQDVRRQYTIKLTCFSHPVDFFAPNKQERCYVVVGARNVVEGLYSAFMMAHNDLVRNAKSFRHWFLEHHHTIYGTPFLPESQ